VLDRGSRYVLHYEKIKKSGEFKESLGVRAWGVHIF